MIKIIPVYCVVSIFAVICECEIFVLLDYVTFQWAKCNLVDYIDKIALFLELLSFSFFLLFLLNWHLIETFYISWRDFVDFKLAVGLLSKLLTSTITL